MGLCFRCQKRPGQTRTEGAFEASLCEVCARQYKESDTKGAELQLRPTDPDEYVWVLRGLKNEHVRVKKTVWAFYRKSDADKFLAKVNEIYGLPNGSHTAKVRAMDLYDEAKSAHFNLSGVTALLPEWERFFERKGMLFNKVPAHIQRERNQKLANPEAQDWLKRERDRRALERMKRKGLI